MAEDHNRKRILIVDDSYANIDILVETLKGEYKLGFAKNGYKAFDYINKTPPDLILLDIVMPGINGYDVCKKLKSAEETKKIPIIFITAIDEIESKTKGFELGAMDYITKPFEVREVLARVKTHLRLAEQEKLLHDYTSKLEHMVEERTRQLVHADRLITLGTFAAAIVHEINNPIGIIRGNAELIKHIWEKGNQDELNELMDRNLTNVIKSADSISRLLTELKSFSKTGNAEFTVCPLYELIDHSLSLLNYRLRKGVKVDIDIQHHIQIRCEPQKIVQVFVNLVNNAIDSMDDKIGKIAISAEVTEKDVRIRLKDNGIGISQDFADKIFGPFFSTKSQGAGLGLFIVQNIIEEHGGKIFLVSDHQTGTAFDIVLPSADPVKPYPLTNC